MAQFKTQLVSNKNWNENRIYKVNSIVLKDGVSYQNIDGLKGTPGISSSWIRTNNIDKSFESFGTFKFVQKGYGNVDLLNHEIGDVFCGWKNDGTERWAEAKWLGGTLTNSDNFKPMFAAEREI